jgi:hypothetical protein
MNRQKLKLDDLLVESFDTVLGPPARGTVRGHDYSEACFTDEYPTCPRSCPYWETCNQQTCDTCALSCGGTCHTCGDSCWGSCPAEYTCGGQFSCDAPACTQANAHC